VRHRGEEGVAQLLALGGQALPVRLAREQRALERQRRLVGDSVP